jgi:hypothetical protein
MNFEIAASFLVVDFLAVGCLVASFLYFGSDVADLARCIAGRLCFDFRGRS